ncbi:MAG: ABC transporter ATP-binding protein [Clostridiaceae bacterium]
MKNFLKVLTMIQKKRKNFLLLVAIQSLIGGLLPLLNVIIPKLIVDELLSEKRIEILLLMIGVLALSNWIKTVVVSYTTLKIDRTVTLIWLELQMDLVEKMNNLPIEVSETKTNQDELEKAMFGLEYFPSLSETIEHVGISLITLVSLFIVLIPFGILIPIGIVVSSMLLIPLLNKQKYLEEDNANRSQPEHRIYRYFLDLATDYRYSKDFKLFLGDKLMMKKAKTTMDNILKINHEYFTKNGILEGLKSIIMQIQIVAALIYLALKYIGGALTVGNFILLLNATRSFQENIMKLLGKTNSIITMNLLFDPMIRYLKNEYKEDVQLASVKIDSNDFNLEFKNVDFSYPNSDHKILKDCSFSINKGERIAIVGRNGAGKSTIIKLICRFYKPTSGTITLNGVNIQDINIQDYYDLLSVTFQDFRLFPFKINENIAGIEEDNFSEGDRNRITNSLEMMQINDWVDTLPQKSETHISKLFSEDGLLFSGGQSQKIALARSIAHGGQFVIMDEPTAALDPKSEEEIFKYMLSLTKGKTSLFISHRLSSTRYADRILVCDLGKITETGNHFELMQHRGLYQKMFETQASQYVD